MFQRSNANRLARSLLVPEPRNSLQEPRCDGRMIGGQSRDLPFEGFGMSTLEICEDNLSVFDMLRGPRSLRKDDPVKGRSGAFFQCRKQKRLGVADETDLARCQPETLPHQPHQPVALRARRRVGVAAGRKNEAAVLRSAGCERLRG